MKSMVVTVVVPTYRRPAQLQACVGALDAQTFDEPWEIVIVDDGSPEPQAIDRAGGLSRRGCRVIRQNNAGPSAARNRGVQEAKGEWIAFTDDDCLPQPEWLALLMRAARARPDAMVGGTTFNGLPDDFFASTSQMTVDIVYEHFNACPDEAHFMASNNFVCRRARFLELGGFDESFRRAGTEDRDFCDRWRMRGWPIVWLPEARVEHRHAQTLRTFLDMHFRYGRGAYRYQTIRRARSSGTIREDFSFHTTLLRRVLPRLGRAGGLLNDARTLAALFAWQAAYAAGFLVQSVLSATTRKEGCPGRSVD